MQDKRKRPLEIEMPDNHSSFATPPMAPHAATAPRLPVATKRVEVLVDDLI